MDGFVSEGGVCLHRILPVDTVRLTPFTVVVIVLLLIYVRQVNSSLSLGPVDRGNARVLGGTRETLDEWHFFVSR